MSLVGKSHTCLTVKNMGNLSQFPVDSFSKLLTHEARLGEVPGSGHGHHGVHSPGEVVALEQEVAEEDGGRHQPTDDCRIIDPGRQPVLVLQTLAQGHPGHYRQPRRPLLTSS